MVARDSYDVVVVGGGTAGCVVAARLAETASRSVLMIEAGADLRSGPPDPLRDGWSIGRQPDWGFKSEPDERGAVANLWRNKIVGGTSWATRFAVRGSPADFDGWTEAGCDGWGFDDVLPYFTRLEADSELGDRPWHGDSGPIPVTRYPHLQFSDVGDAGMRALDDAGFAQVEDHNQPWAVGAGRMPMSSRNGFRVTTADGYLRFDKTPGNLTIRSDALVADVVFDGPVAVGVRLVDGSIVYSGWIVLAAGTYGSAPILMRSGIGPADHLTSLGVPIRAALPGVGAGLSDHPAVSVECPYRGAPKQAPTLHSIATFHSEGMGSSDAPDLMLWISDPEQDDQPSFAIDAVLLKPRSRGSVRLRSLDPTDPPVVMLPGLHEETDIRRLAEALERATQVMNEPGIRRLCDVDSIDTVTDPAGWVRENRYSIPHVVGTCAMGRSPDAGAVVDSSGTVFGVERLSVVDASIMPDAPSGFPHLVTIMIAEKLAEHLGAVVGA